MSASTPATTSRPRAPALRPGDRLYVTAPAGPVDASRVRRSLKTLRRDLEALGSASKPRQTVASPKTRAEIWQSGAEFPEFAQGRIFVASQVTRRRGYFAGDDRERSEALLCALRDPESRTIWPARGGYGVTRILSRLEGIGLTFPFQAPRIIGFSDITALLCWAYTRFGLASIHGPVLAQYAEIHPLDRQRALDLLRGEIAAPLEAEAGPALFGGRVEGPLVAANLELLRTLVGTPYLPNLEGHILALEDVGERPYRIDRSLTQLIESGALRGIRGIALGTFEACDPPREEQPTAQEVLLERLQPLGVPLLGGFPFGHQRERNAALPFGTRVRLDVDQGVLEMLEPVFAPSR